MKFAIDIGHNAPPKDRGAMGIRFEDELTRGVGRELIKILVRNKHTVIETAPTFALDVISSLKWRVKEAHYGNADVFVSIHFNAFNSRAHGTEIYALSRIGLGIATEINTEIVKLGFYNRGVKRAPFYVLKHTTMPAVLIECCFCDSKKDMDLFDAKKMATAIATGLIGDLPPIDYRLRTLRVKSSTWLKQSTESSTDLSDEQKEIINSGKYQVVVATPAEEAHHYVELVDGRKGFLYAGHVEVS